MDEAGNPIPGARFEMCDGDKSKPMHAAILMLISLDAILGMIVFKLLKS